MRLASKQWNRSVRKFVYTVTSRLARGLATTLSKFSCERCHDSEAVYSRLHGLVEYTLLLPLPVRFYRCGYCGDRYATFGWGKHRVIIHRKIARAARWGAVALLCAGAVAALVTLVSLR